MLNLTGNALKFTFSGHVRLKAQRIEVEGIASTCVKISVEDTGLGMKEDDIQHLFKMFSKLESTREENKSGTGLGLMISNKLALRLAPKDNKGIQVQSVHQQGSTFSFILEDKVSTLMSSHSIKSLNSDEHRIPKSFPTKKS